MSARFYQHLSIYVFTQEPDPEPELSAYEEIESGLLNIGVAPGKLEASGMLTLHLDDCCWKFEYCLD